MGARGRVDRACRRPGTGRGLIVRGCSPSATAGKIAKKGRLPCSKTVRFFSKIAPLLAVFSRSRRLPTRRPPVGAAGGATSLAVLVRRRRRVGRSHPSDGECLMRTGASSTDVLLGLRRVLRPLEEEEKRRRGEEKKKKTREEEEKSRNGAASQPAVLGSTGGSL